LPLTSLLFIDIAQMPDPLIDSVPQPVLLTKKYLASFEAALSSPSILPQRKASSSRNASSANIDACNIQFDI
jgi:hypothetical protein